MNNIIRKAAATLLSASLLFSAVPAFASVDLSGMSFDELVELREQLNLALWNSADWQEVTVPAGIWIVGEDIPAGHWTIRVAASHDILNVSYFDKIDAVGKGVAPGCYLFSQVIASPGYSAFGESNAETVDIDAQEGWYIKLNGAVIFTPYTGKPDLGFK